MAIQSEPTRISTPFADAGTKNVIPETMAQPSATAAASWQAGFPTVCSLPLSAGGIPPARNDFNGLFNQMTQTERFLQDGGIFAWDASTDYGANRLVLGADGKLYWSIAQSGPNTSAGAVNPTADSAQSYWTSAPVPTRPATDSSSSLASTAYVTARIQYLSSPFDLYLDVVNGDDSNDARTPEKAAKTIQGLRDIVAGQIRQIGYDLKVHVASGTYTEQFTSLFSQSSVYYVLDSGVTFPGASVVQPGCRVSLSGGPAIATGSIGVDAGGTQVYLRGGLDLTFKDITASAAFSSFAGGYVHMIADSDTPINITFSNCSFSQGTALASAGSIIRITGPSYFTFNGTPTGQRYRCSNTSGILFSGSPTFFPGTANGSADATSWYS